jgi:acyl carrier protein
MISERLKGVILKELKLNNFDIKDEMQAFQVPGWDSLSHVGVIVAVEKEFGCRFKMKDLMKLRSVGELQELVNRMDGKSTS